MGGEVGIIWEKLEKSKKKNIKMSKIFSVLLKMNALKIKVFLC